MLLLVHAAFAHGARFGVSAISVAPDDPATWWAVANGWGVVHTEDAGASWTWSCEEALGTSAVYDVEALPDRAALVATEAGLLRVGADCSVVPVAGIEAGYPAFVVATGQGDWWVSAYTEGRDGLWRCTETTCTPGPVGAEGTFVKSAVVDGDTLWLTTVAADSLAAALLRVDGEDVVEVATWPDGTVDPRVLLANGADLLVWAQGRDVDHPPALLHSTDAGAQFVNTLSVGVYTDPIPGILDGGDGASLYLGTDAGRTFFSSNGGASWTEVTETVPVVRCSATTGAGRVFCADHYSDGYDVGVWQFGRPFEGAGCLDAATPPTCTESCADYLAAFQEAGLYGGGACYPVEVAPPPTGCGGGAAWLVCLVPLARWGRRPQGTV